MRRVREGAAPAERGFVLVGVVILVLALTILGLSLFSLSSYEGQFLGQRLSGAQAIYGAESGQEIVKSVLSASPYLLSDAHLAEGQMGIVYASARQQKLVGGSLQWTESGYVDPDPYRPVWVKVACRQGTSIDTLEALYTPGRRKEYYKRLFTTPGQIDCDLWADLGGGPPEDRRGTTELHGNLWEGVPPGAQNYRTPDVVWGPPDSAIVDTGLDVPDVAGFIAARLPGALLASENVGTDSEIELGIADGAVHYYYGPAPTNDCFYESGSGTLTLKIRGKVVWLLPYGMRSDKKVKVQKEGGTDAALVVVAGPNAGTLDGDVPFNVPENGLWFFSSFESEDQVPVALVSSGNVVVEFAGNGTGQTDARAVTVFAANIRTLGPRPGGGSYLRMTYAPSMEPVLDALMMAGALPLPVVAGVRSPFALVPGSWHEVGP